MSDHDDRPVITIRPEPSPEELAAIIAAVTAALASTPAPETPPTRPISRWARQGRLDAMRGRDDEGM